MPDIDEMLDYLLETEESDRQGFIRNRAALDRDAPALRDFEKEYKKSFGDGRLDEARREYNLRRTAGKVGKRVYDTAGFHSGGANLPDLKRDARSEEWVDYLGEGVQRAARDDGLEADRSALARRGADLARGTQGFMDALKSVNYNLGSTLSGNQDAFDDVEDRRQLLQQGRAADPTQDEDSQVKGFGDLAEKLTTKPGGWLDVGESAASGVAQQAPALIGSALMRDPRLFLAYWTAQMQPDARADFIEQGYSREAANSLGWLSAIAQAKIEAAVRIEHGDATKMGFFKAAAGEFREEFDQKAVHESIMAISKAASGGDYDARQRIFIEANRELANALVVVPALSGAGVGAGKVSKRLWADGLSATIKEKGDLDASRPVDLRLLAGLLRVNSREDIERAIASPSQGNLERVGLVKRGAPALVEEKRAVFAAGLKEALALKDSGKLDGVVEENAERAAAMESAPDIEEGLDSLLADEVENEQEEPPASSDVEGLATPVIDPGPGVEAEPGAVAQQEPLSPVVEAQGDVTEQAVAEGVSSKTVPLSKKLSLGKKPKPKKMTKAWVAEQKAKKAKAAEEDAADAFLRENDPEGWTNQKVTEYLGSPQYQSTLRKIATKNRTSDVLDEIEGKAHEVIAKLVRDGKEIDFKKIGGLIWTAAKRKSIDVARKQKASKVVNADLAKVQPEASENFTDKQIDQASDLRQRAEKQYFESIDPWEKVLWESARVTEAGGREFHKTMPGDLEALHPGEMKRLRKEHKQSGGKDGLRGAIKVKLEEMESEIIGEGKRLAKDDPDVFFSEGRVDLDSARARLDGELDEAGVKMRPNKDDPVRFDAIVSAMSKIFGLKSNQLRLSRIKSKKGAPNKGAAGIFRLLGEGIELRQKAYSDVETTVHEIGHLMAKKYDLESMIPDSLKSSVAKLDYDPNQLRLHEGLSELFRLHLVSDQALANDPAFAAVNEWITQLEEKTGPAKLRRSMRKARELIRSYRQLSALEAMKARIGSEISRAWMGETKPAEIVRKLNRGRLEMVRDWISDTAMLEALYREAGLEPEAHGRSRASAVQHLQARGHGAAKRRADMMITDGVTDLEGKVIGPSIKEIVEGLGRDEVQDLSSFMVARHIVAQIENGDDRLTPWSLDEARAVLAEFTPEQQADYTRRHQMYVQMMNASLDVMVEAGHLSSSSRDAMIESMGDTYVPLVAVTDTESGAISRGKSRRGPGTQLRKGHAQDIKDPFLVAVERVQDRYARAFRSEAVRAAAMDFDPQWGGVEGADNIMRPLDLTETSEKPTELVHFMKDGKEVEVRYELHPDFREMLDYAPKESVIPGLGAVATINRLFKMSVTGVNLAFATANIVRDLVGAVIHGRYADAKTRLKMLGGAAAVVMQPQVALGGLVGLNVLKQAAAHAKPGTLLAKLHGPLAKALESEGVGLKQEFASSSKVALDQIRRMGKADFSMGGAWYGTGRMVDRAIDAISALDMIPRMIEAEAWLAKEQGIDIKDGQFVSQETGKPVELTKDQKIKLRLVAENSTTNFTRAGRQGRALNRLIPFFNAAIQSQVRIKQALVDDLFQAKRGRAVQARVGMGIASMVGLSVAYALAQAGDDGEEDERYRDLDPYVKYRYWIIPGTNVRIPKPYDWAFVSNIAEGTVSSMRGEMDAKKLRDAATWTAGAQLPPVMPATLEPVLELYSNRDNYTGREIVSRYDDRSPLKRTDKKTTLNAQHVAWLAGLPGRMAGKQDWQPSPIAVDFLANNWTGGAWELINHTAEGRVKAGKLSERLMGLPSRPFELKESTGVPRRFDAWWQQMKTLKADHEDSGNAALDARLARAKFADALSRAIWKKRRTKLKKSEKEKWVRYAAGIQKWAMDEPSKRLINPLDPEAPAEVRELLEAELAKKLEKLGAEGQDDDLKFAPYVEMLRGLKVDRERAGRLLMGRRKKGFTKGYQVQEHHKRVSRVLRRLRTVHQK